MGLKDIFRRQKTKDDLPEHIINHHQTAEKLNIFEYQLKKLSLQRKKLSDLAGHSAKNQNLSVSRIITEMKQV